MVMIAMLPGVTGEVWMCVWLGRQRLLWTVLRPNVAGKKESAWVWPAADNVPPRGVAHLHFKRAVPAGRVRFSQ